MGDGKLGLTSEPNGFIEGLVSGMVLGDTEGAVNLEEFEAVKKVVEVAGGVMEGRLGDSDGKLLGNVFCFVDLTGDRDK